MIADRTALDLGWGSVSVLTYAPDDHPRADVLLLHGGGLDNAWLSWSGLGPALAASGYRVLAPDTPGYGLSAPAPWSATQERLVGHPDQMGGELIGDLRPIGGCRQDVTAGNVDLVGERQRHRLTSRSGVEFAIECNDGFHR